MCAGVLEHDDPLSVSRTSSTTEGSVARAGQSSSRLYERRTAQLGGVQEIGSLRGRGAGWVLLQFRAESQSGHRFIPQQFLLPGVDPAANSDSGAAAYTDSAIDQAHRAVRELLT